MDEQVGSSWCCCFKFPSLERLKKRRKFLLRNFFSIGLGKPGSTWVTSPSWVKGRVRRPKAIAGWRRHFAFWKAPPNYGGKKLCWAPVINTTCFKKKFIVISCIPTYRMRLVWRRLSSLIVWLFLFSFTIFLSWNLTKVTTTWNCTRVAWNQITNTRPK